MTQQLHTAFLSVRKPWPRRWVCWLLRRPTYAVTKTITDAMLSRLELDDDGNVVGVSWQIETAPIVWPADKVVGYIGKFNDDGSIS